MRPPIDYDHGNTTSFGGALPTGHAFDEARCIILPLPLDRTTSYVPGTRFGPREILDASSHLELWDEELGVDPHRVGIHTLPPMEFTRQDLGDTMAEIERVARTILERDKFLIALGGEHSISGPLVAAAARVHRDVTVLQIDAHSDLRDVYMGTPFNHACAMRRVLDHARGCTQVGIRSMCAEEVEVLPSLPTRVFYDVEMRRDPHWMQQVVESLGPTVYVTIDLDGLDPAIMPSVGTPEPGGLSWYETIGLLRLVFERCRVVACDVVELCPIPGLVAPNFLAARLVYKLIAYKVAAGTAVGMARHADRPSRA